MNNYFLTKWWTVKQSLLSVCVLLSVVGIFPTRQNLVVCIVVLFVFRSNGKKRLLLAFPKVCVNSFF